MITPIFWLAPITSLIALGAAFYFYKQTLKESEGTDKPDYARCEAISTKATQLEMSMVSVVTAGVAVAYHLL